MKKLLSDTLFLSIAGFVNQSKGIVFIPIIVAGVGLDGYGAFVQILLTARLVSSLSTCELGMGFPRFAARISGEARRELARHFHSVLLPTLVLGVLGALLVAAGAGRLSAWFFDDRFRATLEVASVVVLSNGCFAMARNYLRARERFKSQSILTLAYEILPYVGFVAGAITWHDVHRGILLYAAVDVIVATLAVLYALRGVGLALPSPALVRSYLRYSLPLSLSLVQGGLLARVDLYFISYFLGLHALATYNVVYRVTEIISFVSIPINAQILTYLSPTWDRGHVEHSRAIVRNTLLVFITIAIGMLGCLALYFDALFALFLPAADRTEPLLILVLFIGAGMIANTCRRFLYVLIRLNRTTRDELRYQLAGLTLNVVANYLLVPIYGLAGAAFATLLSYGVMLPVISAKYSLDLDTSFLKDVASFALLACVIVPLRYAIPPDTVALLVLSAGMAYVAYLGAVLLFKRRLVLSLKEDVIAWRKLASPAST